MKKILIAYDGSDYAKKAVSEGKKLAGIFSSELIILYVSSLHDSPNIYAGTYMQSNIKEETKDGDKIVNECLADFKDFNSNVKGYVEDGDPASKIVEVAEKEGADLIILGSRGLSGVRRLFLGSVSSKVVNHAHISVLVVK